jgi:FAD/FMN-containing dehydrogenase
VRSLGSMSMTLDLSALERAVEGDVVLPGSPDYDAARKPAIARFHDARPEAVVRCESTGDVAETIAFARRAGIPAVPRSGGHCFAGRSSTEGIVIDVRPMRSVFVSGGLATVGAGARLGEVYDALDEQGLTMAAGCGPEVGIAGLTLGGGLGILGRSHGLTSDQLRMAQVVLADGRVVECDERHDEDLFWALRGAGGGSFGVVTSLVFDCLRARDATSFHLTWPYSEATAVVDAWQGFAPAAREELAASVLVKVGGDSEEQPAAHLIGAMLGSESETAEQLDELVARAGAEPASAVTYHASYRETKRWLSELGDETAEAQDDGHPFSKSEFFRRPLPLDAVAALVAHLPEDRPAGQARELDFTPWGGAYNRVPADATAFAHRDELFLLKQAVVVDPSASAAERQEAQRWLARSWQLVHPWGSGGIYPNFPDPDFDDWSEAYHGGNRERLLRVRASYDPDGFFGH